MDHVSTVPARAFRTVFKAARAAAATSRLASPFSITEPVRGEQGHE